MNPPEYNKVANELLPMFMFKLSNFLAIPNDDLERYNNMLDEITKYIYASDKKAITSLFNSTIINLVTTIHESVTISVPQKSVSCVIYNHNPKIKMPVFALNCLMSHIHDKLTNEFGHQETHIVKSASEVIVCNNKMFNEIEQSIITWLTKNSEYYVIV